MVPSLCLLTIPDDTVLLCNSDPHSNDTQNLSVYNHTVLLYCQKQCYIVDLSAQYKVLVAADAVAQLHSFRNAEYNINIAMLSVCRSANTTTHTVEMANMLSLKFYRCLFSLSLLVFLTTKCYKILTGSP